MAIAFLFTGPYDVRPLPSPAQLKQQLDMASLHAGCPVIKGIKWSATKWRARPPPTALLSFPLLRLGQCLLPRVCAAAKAAPRLNPPPLPPLRMHVGEFQAEARRRRLRGCADMHDGCPTWAASGECEKNPAYMVRKRALKSGRAVTGGEVFCVCAVPCSAGVCVQLMRGLSCSLADETHALTLVCFASPVTDRVRRVGWGVSQELRKVPEVRGKQAGSPDGRRAGFRAQESSSGGTASFSKLSPRAADAGRVTTATAAGGAASDGAACGCRGEERLRL